MKLFSSHLPPSTIAYIRDEDEDGDKDEDKNNDDYDLQQAFFSSAPS